MAVLEVKEKCLLEIVKPPKRSKMFLETSPYKNCCVRCGKRKGTSCVGDETDFVLSHTGNFNEEAGYEQI